MPMVPCTEPQLQRSHRLPSVLTRFVVIVVAAVAAACGGSELSSCEDDGVVLDSGVRVEDVECGRGEIAESGWSVRVDYVATLEDGEEFDSTEQRGAYTFRLGAGQVIDGLDEGLENMRVGGTRRVTIPPDYAYGSVGLPPLVPPNATVTYEVELLRASEPEI